MLTEFNHYRDYLCSVLAERTRRNPRYSMRAFARDLKFQPARLSDVLNGKKGISVEAAVQMARQLNLTERESSYLCDLVHLVHDRSEDAKDLARCRIERERLCNSFEVVREAVLQVMSEWYFIAILEMVDLAEFKLDATWIANRLGVTTAQAENAVDRLLGLGLLVEKDGRYLRTQGPMTTSMDVPNETIRRLTAQLIEKGSQALVEQPIESRDFSTLTLAIDKKKLSEAAEIIARCRRELTAMLATNSGDAVYCLSTQFFRLDVDA